MDDILYTIHEVESETGISAYTIRYYDKCGFFNPIARTSQGRRRFSQDDIDRLLLVDALKKSGLSIDGLKNIAPNLDDEDAINELLGIMNQRLGVLDIQIEDLTNCQKRISAFMNHLVSQQASLETEASLKDGNSL